MVLPTLSLFGFPHLQRDGRQISINRRKAVAILAYLTINDKSFSRNELATLFWPASSQSKALANLRRDISILKSVLGEDVLDISRNEVGIKNRAALIVDVTKFQATLNEIRQHHFQANPNQICDACGALLEGSIYLYSGEFLGGFTLSDCPEFDAWQSHQSGRLRRELCWALEKLVEWLQHKELYKEGVEFSRQWVAIDPLHEPAQRTLMTLLEQNGQHSAALRQYAECIRVLQNELGVKPTKETKTLYKNIQRRKLFSPQDQDYNFKINGLESNKALNNQKHNLPLQSTRFLGREQELDALEIFLQASDIRIVTILGVGGIGKTRLALAIAD